MGTTKHTTITETEASVPTSQRLLTTGAQTRSRLHYQPQNYALPLDLPIFRIPTADSKPSVKTVSGYGLDDRSSIPYGGGGILSSPPLCPHQVWAPYSSLLGGNSMAAWRWTLFTSI
jgi:hypothetical protein